MNTTALEVKINAVQIMKTLARNLGTTLFDYVEDISKLCIESLLTDQFAMTIRKESAKLMRFLIGACKDYPDKQRALFIMAYARQMEELEKRKSRQEFEQVNSILKEIYKQLKNFYHFKKKGLTVFTEQDAHTLIDRMVEVAGLIKNDKATRLAKV